MNSLNEKLEALLEPSGADSGKWSRLGSRLKELLSGGSSFGEVGQAKRDLQELSASIRAMTKEVIEETERSIRRKGRKLEEYTVTLFGRTMTGKSTIREFVTRGDGSTIGEGAQRTTQSIHEYSWEGLRIVDTPGFGAFDGEEDSRLARTMIEESDLILFLMATVPAIQRPSFEEMSRLYEQGKPILFVLNVTHDLEDNGGDLLLDEFLESPEEAVFDPEELEGYVDRIEDLASKHLRIDSRTVQTCPIHAQAAFLSTQPEYEEHADSLLQGSRIHDLLRMLSEDVRENGVQRRRQTITGGTMHAVASLKARLAEEYDALGEQTAYLEKKIDRLGDRLSREKREVLQNRIPDAAARIFDPLQKRISTFIDDNIQREDVGKKWKAEVERLNLHTKVKSVQQDLEASLQQELRSFGEEMASEAEIMAMDVEPSAPSQRDPINWKRGLRWASAGSGVLGTVAGIAGQYSAANFWNPSGVILGSVAVATGIAAYFTSSKNEKLQEAKNEAAQQLRNEVQEMEASVRDDLREQYENHLFPAYADHAVGMLRTLRTSLVEVRSLLNQKIKHTESVRSRLASRLPDAPES
ncbi:GTPase Era involved in 16S rRNA processing [Salinibacter ruber]|uniref:GTPase domain-containing protein n=1 Tax=Salinibacter ruber TaxID=146919 RepID=UPI002168616F|nr:GTPase Era involved in 16S rRNA processing [Salinibacter ruber]